MTVTEGHRRRSGVCSIEEQFTWLQTAFEESPWRISARTTVFGVGSMRGPRPARLDEAILKQCILNQDFWLIYNQTDGHSMPATVEFILMTTCISSVEVFFRQRGRLESQMLFTD